MNILLVYRSELWSPPFYLEKALKKKHNVNVYAYDFLKSPYWGDFKFKLPFYIPKGLPVSVQSVIKKFNKNFDLLVEVTTAGQYHLTGYKKMSIPTVLWALDIYRFDQRKFILWVKNDFDYVFTTQKNFVDIISTSHKSLPAERKGTGGGGWLTYACDPEIQKKFCLSKIYDVVFIGNTNAKIYPERIKMLKLIGEKFNLKVFNGVYGEGMAKIYSQAKIVFNKSADGEINMRVFEALSCGGLLLTDRLKQEVGLEEIFEDKKHLVLYDNGNDLLEKIDYYLEHETEREEIALTGHREVVLKHTYDHRAEEILRTVKR